MIGKNLSVLYPQRRCDDFIDFVSIGMVIGIVKRSIELLV